MRRPAKPATRPYLERVALHYLERYPGSEAKLRRTLMRRVQRSVRELGTDPAEGEAAVDQVVLAMRERGYVDDARFARDRAASMSRRGKSQRAIRAALYQHGIGGEDADRALGEHDDLEAARALVRRARLDASDPERRNKALAKLARAGFSFDVARRALETDEE
ncbi:MAG: regulatory protein RecX [Sandaracinaceae bacterium]